MEEHDEDWLFFGAEATPNLLGNVNPTAPVPTAAATGSGQSATAPGRAPPPPVVTPTPQPVAPAPTPTPTPTPVIPQATVLAVPAPKTWSMIYGYWWLEAIVASIVGILTFKAVHHPKVGFFKNSE